MSKCMNSWLKVGSFNKKDEYYTPAIMVYPILEYLKPGSTIWCPFDTERSEFVRVFTASGFKVLVIIMKELPDNLIVEYW